MEKFKPLAKFPASLRPAAKAGRAFLETFVPRLVKTQLRHAPNKSLERAICRYLLSPKTFLMFSVVLECLPDILLLGILSSKDCGEFFPVTVGIWINPDYTSEGRDPILGDIEDPTMLKDQGERIACAEEILTALFTPFINVKVQELQRKLHTSGGSSDAQLATTTTTTLN